VRGQEFNEKNVIPRRLSGKVGASQSNAIPSQIPQQPQQPQQPEDDLIDFGQNESSPGAQQTSAPTSYFPSGAKPRNVSQGQKDLEQMIASTSTSYCDGQGSLIDFQEDLQKSLPTQPSKREETSDDDFADAEE
jgi:hypothetical protein